MPSGTAQEEALLSLVGRTGKTAAWSTSLQGWNANAPVCDWEGITCRIGTDYDGPDWVVAEVNLPSVGLSGTIPTELGLLSNLEHLILKNNILKGSIPQEIANLKKLVTLDLTECFLTGTLPQRFESPHLQTLLLANNAISGRFFEADDSPHLSSIQEIRMENNLLTGMVHGPSMHNMPNLETLSLSANDLSDLIPGEGLGALPKLKYLYLDSNHFVGPLPSQLARVGKAQLLELWLQDNAISGTVPASYARFDKLHDFYIDGNKLTGEIPQGICGPEVNADFFTNAPDGEHNYCDSIACPAGSVAFEGVYPCTECPGGEAARLKNRYLGQTGRCSNHTQRDILKIFYEATTKAGSWSGVSDWDDEKKPVCDMTGITCDAHGNVVEIMLKNRRLEGHIPDEIGFLSFLESMDVSDNNLLGYLPSDLQWTAIKKLDISGNKVRGIIPPLLCTMEELNGNGGDDNGFICDRIACPAGTFNAFGFHQGGETCQTCETGSPFIAQKVCAGQATSIKSDWRETVHIAEEKASSLSLMGVVLATALVGIVVLAIYWSVKTLCSSSGQKYDEHGNLHRSSDEEEDDDTVGEPSFHDDDSGHNKTYSYNEEEEGVYSDGYSGHDRYRASVYRDYRASDEQHQGISLNNRRDKGIKGVDLNRRESGEPFVPLVYL